MPSDDGKLEIRSYHTCFRLERRLHKIERWRIPVPYGIPLRAIVYAAAVLLAMLILSGLPVSGDVLGVLHPWFRFAAIPAAAGWALTRWKVDGRSAPAAGAAWARWRAGPSRVAAFRAAPAGGEATLGAVTVAPDGQGATLRHGLVRGPATVVLRYPIHTRPRGRTLHVHQRDGAPLWRGTQVRLSAGQRMVVS
jgi:hypothetical protein